MPKLNKRNIKFTIIIFGIILTFFAISNLLFAADITTKKGLSNNMAKSSSKKIVVAIDPGHPSETSAGCAYFGMREVDICWEIALKLEKLIAHEPSLTPIKTKLEVNTKVTNKRRAEIANEAKAAILVRLHCDSGKGTGCTVYYPDKQGNKNGFKGPSAEVISKSRLAALAMQSGLKSVLGKYLKINPIKTDSVTYVGSKQGALTGSIYSKVPTLVIEMVYLSNASDAAFIRDNANQELVAKGILAGIKKFVNVK